MENSTAAIIIFLITILLSIIAFKRRNLAGGLIMVPYDIVRNNRWYTIITSGFIHADWSHLIFNMVTYYFFCFSLEEAIGARYFLIIYFISMIVADIPSIIKNKDNPGYASLGASGAISGALFSYIILNPFDKLIIFPLPIPLPAAIYGVLYLIYCQYAAKNSQDNVNHNAHFWGAIAGVILMALLMPEAVSSLLENIF